MEGTKDLAQFSEVFSPEACFCNAQSQALGKENADIGQNYTLTHSPCNPTDGCITYQSRQFCSWNIYFLHRKQNQPLPNLTWKIKLRDIQKKWKVGENKQCIFIIATGMSELTFAFKNGAKKLRYRKTYRENLNYVPECHCARIHDYQIITLLISVKLTMISKDGFAFSSFPLSCCWEVDLAGLHPLIKSFCYNSKFLRTIINALTPIFLRLLIVILFVEDNSSCPHMFCFR